MKKYIAEAVGTMMLTLIACGVAVLSGANLVATSLAFGLVIIAMAYTIGHVSGCHINPAVSFGMLIAGKMKPIEFAKYVAAQIVGAFAGTLLLGLCLDSFSALGANSYGGDTSLLVALLVEVILTFIFVTVILSVTSKKENSNVSGIIIGLTLTLVHLFGIRFTGTSVNPARSLAPAIFQGGDALTQVWIFIVAPLAGAALAALFYKYVLKD